MLYRLSWSGARPRRSTSVSLPSTARHDDPITPWVGLTKAIDTCEALGQQAYEHGSREADDVQVVALHPLDECGAATLDRVAACAPFPLAARGVPGEIARRQRAECDERRGELDVLPAGRHERQAGDDGMRTTRKLLEHAFRVRNAVGLRVDAAFEDDCGVDAEHRPVTRVVRDRARLRERVVAYELGRVGLRRIVL